MKQSLSTPMKNAFVSWKQWRPNGKKYIYFEHHCEVFYGIRFNYNYDQNTYTNLQILDEKKYMLFLLKYSNENN